MSEALTAFRDAREKLAARLREIKDEMTALSKEVVDIETVLGPEPKATRGKDKAPRKRKGQEAPCQP